MSDLPGNEFVLKRLRDLLASGQAIAFVGAGASAGLYPLWNELIEKLAQEAIDRGLATEADRTFWRKSKPQQAVRGIKQALGDSVYGHALRDIFRPKPDGDRFTRVHAALARLPFRGLATVNYDPGLVEARRALRSDIISTGYATWKDADPVQRWLTGDEFQPGALPILFAHGVHERSDTIVLAADEFRDAYRSGGYRRLFDKLWGQDRLVFVGFGFSDPWLDFLADEVITQTAAQAAGEPRHIALVGLDEGEEYTPERRKSFQDQYNAAVYFYRVARTADGASDHGDLVRVLEALVAELAPKKV